MQELDAGVLGRELPVHGRAQGVAIAHPTLGLGLYLGLAADCLVLGAQRARLAAYRR